MRGELEFRLRAGAPQGLAVLLVVAVLATFAPACGNGFVAYDDDHYVTENPNVSQGLTRAGLAWALGATRVGNWHPLTWLSHMLDCELFGLAPAGHHATSVVLHAVNAALLIWLLVRATGELWPAAFAAAWFALHPLRVESVAWVAERKDVLSGLFFLLALHCWISFVRCCRWSHYAAALVVFAAALLSKPMVVTLPVVLLLLDVWPLARTSAGARRLLLEKLPFFALAALTGAIALRTQGPGIHSGLPVGLRLSNAVLGYAAYVRQSAWPSDLGPLYPLELAPDAAAVALAALALVAASAAAALAARRHPCFVIGWFWFLLMLLPVSGVVPIGFQSHADRYTYLPQIGLAIALGWGVPEILPRFRLRALVLAGSALAVLVTLAAATFVQIEYWRDTRTLFARAVAVTRDNWFAHTELAIALTAEGRLDEALAHYGRALALQPNYPRARANHGHWLLLRGRPREALEEFDAALRLDPDMPELRHFRGVAREALGDPRGAAADYAGELARNPDYEPSRERLARLRGAAAPR